MSFSPSPVVIFPASSRSGAQAANLLLSQGLKVRAVARNLSKLESLKALGAEIVQADLSQPESIKSALQDAQALYFVNPTPYDGSDMFKEAQRVAQHLTEALEDSSVKRVVLLSSIGAEQPTGTGNIRTVYIIEEALKKLSSKMEIVFLRAGAFVENWSSVANLALSPPHILPSMSLPIDKAFPQVCTQDIGTAAAKYISISSSTLSSSGPTVVELSGPRELSSIDVAAAFEKVNGGNKVTAVPVEEKDFESTLEKAMPKNVAESHAEMMRAFMSGKISWTGGEDVIKERGATEIEVALREML